MAQPLCTVREIAAIITRSRDSQVAGGDPQRGQRNQWRGFQFDPPRLAVGPDAGADTLAADLDQKIAAAVCTAGRSQPVDGMALADPRQVERDVAGAAGADAFKLDTVRARCRQCRRDCRVVGQIRAPTGSAEAP